MVLGLTVNCSGQVTGPSITNPGDGGTGGPGATGGSGPSGGTGGNSGKTGGKTGGTTGGGTGGGSGSSTCAPLAPLPRRLWRLSVEQYGNAVRDVLGLSAAPVLSNRGGQAAYAFFSDVSLGVDASFQFALYQSSQDVINGLTTAQLNAVTGCGTATDATCAMSVAQKVGAKAFRRPLEAAEVTNLMKVYTQGAMTDGPTGLKLMLQALLISPSFVYRTELGPSTLAVGSNGSFPDTTLTPYEIASQLGFLFLGSLPDAGLLSAAADGSLGTTAGLTAQIDRLLASSTVRSNLTSIVIDWFNVRQMFDKTKDTALLSTLATADQDQSAIASDLLTATRKFVDGVLWQGTGKVSDLLTSPSVYVNKRLATLYPGLTYASGAPTSNTTFVAASWPTTQGRAGMLTQPAFLWSASDPALTSIVKRGKLIHDDVLCQDALPPPVDLSTPMAMNVIACKAPDGTTSLSTCDSEILHSDARMMYQPCKGCHAQMDPYARVLQNFGPIGNYRTTDEAGRALDTSVTFAAGSPLAPQSVTGAQSFADALIKSKVLDGCAVQKMASYAMGSMVRTYSTCELDDLRAKTDGTVVSLFREVALASFLRTRTGGKP